MMASCKLCQGSGKVILFRSWLASDGYRFARCAICEGSGYTRHQASSGWLFEQRRARKIFGISARSALTPRQEEVK